MHKLESYSVFFVTNRRCCMIFTNVFFLYTSGYRERFYERSTTLMEKNRGVCSSFVDVLDSCGPALDCERDALPASGYLSSSQSATYSPVIEKPSESVTTILC